MKIKVCKECKGKKRVVQIPCQKCGGLGYEETKK